MINAAEAILTAIKNAKEPTTMEIVRKSGLSKVTVLKYLAKLMEERQVEYRRIGPSKVWAIRQNAKEHPSFNNIKPTMFNLLKEFERLTGSRANIIIETRGPSLRTTLTVKPR